MKITMLEIAKLSQGSMILGCGGGGDFDEGYNTALKAIESGEVELISLEELETRGEDGVIVTISGVGSPASEEAYYSTDVYPVILNALQEKIGKKIIGFIACEIGASSTFEPFIPAAIMGVPVIDAPCDGRAHPLGLMGALGLEKKGEPVWQSAAGGKKESGKYLEMTVSASVETASNLVRNAASAAGGAVAVARNPVTLEWLKESGAKGAYQQTMQLGTLWNSDEPVHIKSQKLAEALGGEIVCAGEVTDFELNTDNALDRGSFKIKGNGKTCEMHFFNEYMTLDVDGQRYSTFPDVMITIDAASGVPLSTAAIENGKEVILITSSHNNVVLGRGLRYRAAYERVQEIIGVNMVDYIEDILLD